MSESDKLPQAVSSGTIGVIMLDTRFPRFQGDIGNPHTWPFEVIFEVVSGASARAVVTDTATQNLQPIINAGINLQRKGVSGITTSCGFLSLFQREIAQHLEVPFLASSLAQLPWIQATLPTDKRVGILTISADSLTPAHLHAAGIDSQVPVHGCEDGREFTRSILGNLSTMDYSLCERDNIEAALDFRHRYPDLGAIVLECTNMAPYASAIQQATGLPVYSIYTLIRWFQSGLSHKAFSTCSGTMRQ
ncbi:MAG: aspartate/glutamate racemase family protein [Granulosicoccus sp.]